MSHKWDLREVRKGRGSLGELTCPGPFPGVRGDRPLRPRHLSTVPRKVTDTTRTEIVLVSLAGVTIPALARRISNRRVFDTVSSIPYTKTGIALAAPPLGCDPGLCVCSVPKGSNLRYALQHTIS